VEYVVLERRGGSWRATTTSEPQLVALGHNTSSARRLIAQRIHERSGKRAKIAVHIVLPERQQAVLEKFLDEQRQCDQVNGAPASRVSCAMQLLALHLTQHEVAELMGISRGLLAVVLHRARAGQR
jgi:CRP-like cAMP-binding protein